MTTSGIIFKNNVVYYTFVEGIVLRKVSIRLVIQADVFFYQNHTTYRCNHFILFYYPDLISINQLKSVYESLILPIEFV